ncbi:hypothetical protein MSAN_01302200 [Mycena sanguinolenta]|uniref:G-protein coupled receptors family 2 profile 2 domain-containing protein n=1 Tax=Mycena sanguinolenta TaxID=230812 RepID=A0A8H6YEZ7_9AGAR|nr:hypothetical protein MSAN_01302200 [Mycena sanguinolenta]
MTVLGPFSSPTIMSHALHSRLWSTGPPIVAQVLLVLLTPGIGLTSLLLGLYAYAAWKPVSRRYLDRVSIRLLTYALVAHLCFGILFTIGALTDLPGRRCALLSFLSNLSLVFSAGMFFSMAINLPLVLMLKVNGRRMEKYYIIGITLIGCVSPFVPYVTGHLGWDDVNKICWYRSRDPSAMLHWLIVTQTVWILLASIGEVVSFISIVGYLVLYGPIPEDPQTTCSSTSSNRPASTIRRFRNIVLRIGLYPLVSCIVNISTTVIEFLLFQTGQKSAELAQKRNWRLDLADLSIYAARPLIYGVLAATDPSFIRALRALHHPENELETLSQVRTQGLEMSTIIYLPQDEASIDEENKEDTPGFTMEIQEREEGTSMTSASHKSPAMGNAWFLVDDNGTPASIDLLLSG